MALRLTHPGTEMSTRNILGGGGGGGESGPCVGLTTLPPSCVDCLEILGASTYWSLKPVKACNGIALPLLLCWENTVLIKSGEPNLCLSTDLKFYLVFFVKWRSIDDLPRHPLDQNPTI
jgi:hypothetical protein